MLGRKRLPVDLIGEQHLLAQSLGDREAALEGVLEVALDAAVEPAEDDLLRLRGNTCLLQKRRERSARPLGGADGTLEPRLADRPRLDQRAPVAGALERHGHRPGGQRLHVLEAEGERLLHVPADLEPPRLGVHLRDVEVDQQVVEADRRDVVLQRLERDGVIAAAELKLVEGDLRGVSDGHLGRAGEPILRHLVDAADLDRPLGGRACRYRTAGSSACFKIVQP